MSVGIKLFYVANGAIKENPENLPKTVLAKLSGARSILRVAYDNSEGKLYVQDASSSRLLDSGDDSAWTEMNRALDYIDKTFDARFLKQEAGDPPGLTIKRTASSYRKGWGIVSRAMYEDLGVAPADLQVEEHSHEGEPVKISGGKITVNKIAFIGADGDVDYQKMNNAIADAYLHNVHDIMKAALDGDRLKDFEARWKNYLDDTSDDTFFAIAHDGKTRILRASAGQGDHPHDEKSIRASDGMRGYDGPLVMFSFDPDRKQLVFHNKTLREMYDSAPLSRLAEDVRKRMAKRAGVRSDDLVMSFDPALGLPFFTSIDRYRPVWDYIQSVVAPVAKVQPECLPVVELPVKLAGGAAFVTSPADEDRKAPGARQYRGERTIEAQYPFIVLDNRVRSRGNKYRALLDAYAEFIREGLKRPYSNTWLEDEAKEAQTKAVAHMLRLGMDKRQIVDFLAPRRNLRARAEFRMLVADAWRSLKTKTAAAAASKTAAIGGINDWWHIGSQEELNQARHTEDPSTPRTFNLKNRKIKRKPTEPKPIEEMLHDKHDHELGYQKTTEQLLRESRV
jgi:hypothetical protein